MALLATSYTGAVISTGRGTRILLALCALVPVVAAGAETPAHAARRSAIVLNRVKTDDPVVFVTIDDGLTRDPAVAEFLERRGWPITNFILTGQLDEWESTSFFSLLGSGSDFANHSSTHRALKGMNFERQKAEICGAQRRIEAATWKARKWFRPPFGSRDETTYQAAAACGITHVVMWRVSVNRAGIHTWGDSPVRKGDIILLHFVPDLLNSLKMLAAELDRLGLRPAPRADYLS